MNISLYDSLYIRQNCILSFRNVSIDSLKDRFIHLYIYIYIQKTFQFFIIQHEYYYNMKRRINCPIDHRSVNEGGEPVSSLRNYVKQWRKEERETERERESSLFAALYVYWKIPEALFRSGKLVGEHPRQRLMRGMQFPRAARLSSDAPFPCTIFRAAPNSRICINTGDRRGGSGEGILRGSDAKLTKVCRQSYYPSGAESKPWIFNIDSAVRKTFFSRGGKQQQGGGRNNTELKWKRGKRSTFRIYGKWRFETIVWLSLRAMNIIGLLN